MSGSLYGLGCVELQIDSVSEEQIQSFLRPLPPTDGQPMVIDALHM